MEIKGEGFISTWTCPVENKYHVTTRFRPGVQHTADPALAFNK